MKQELQSSDPQVVWPFLAADSRKKIGMVCSKCGDIRMHSKRWYWPAYAVLVAVTIPFLLTGTILLLGLIPFYLVGILDFLLNQRACPKCRSTSLVAARSAQGIETWNRLHPPRI